MRIQNNIAAMNAHRVMGGNSTNTAKSLEKLSSGFRINRAGDDAAGLAISEKMRAQIKGLETAQKNANDGISLVQTAEGALTEVHSMLNRMTELATQSANGTYDDGVDRANLQKEIESLKSEIDRISDSTNYNGIKLLDGSISQKTVAETRKANGEMEIFTKKTGATGVTLARQEAVKAVEKINIAGFTADGTDAITINFKAVDGENYSFKLNEVDSAVTLTTTLIAGTINGTTADKLAFSSDAATAQAMEKFKETFTIGADGTITAKKAGASAGNITSIVADAPNATPAPTTVALSSVKGTDAGYKIQVDATAVSAGTLNLGDKKIDLVAADTVGDVLSKIKNAGLTASIDPNAATTILITDLDSLKVAQQGTGISTSSSTAILRSDEASAATFVVTLAAATGSTDAKLTFKYTDADGNAKEKELSYNSGAAMTNTGDNIKAAIESDEELKSLFSVSNNAGTLTITSKLEGAGKASVLGMTSTDTPMTQHVASTPGEDKGTIISFGNDQFGTTGAFKAGDKVSVNGKTYQFVDTSVTLEEGATGIKIGANLTESLQSLEAALKKDGITSKVDTTAGTIEIADTAADVKDTAGGLTLQVGESSESFQKVKVSVESMGTKNLGIDKIDVGTQSGAADAMDKIKAAINTVSSTRGNLGAIQNRLEHTMNNLGVAQENMTAAESRIRDVDMAKEMMNFTKNNILVQASQAMLAQANQQPQGVLQLLR